MIVQYNRQPGSVLKEEDFHLDSFIYLIFSLSLSLVVVETSSS
jgi:hypothetical protein